MKNLRTYEEYDPGNELEIIFEKKFKNFTNESFFGKREHDDIANKIYNYLIKNIDKIIYGYSGHALEFNSFHFTLNKNIDTRISEIDPYGEEDWSKGEDKVDISVEKYQYGFKCKWEMNINGYEIDVSRGIIKKIFNLFSEKKTRDEMERRQIEFKRRKDTKIELGIDTLDEIIK